MTTQPPKYRPSIDPSLIFLLIAMLIGGYIRLAPVLQSAVPLNDGGLFYRMTQDLIENEFRLPSTTSYNQLEIPFAYPPLSFYLAGLLAKLTGWQLLDIVRILPAVFTVLTIPAFYLLARRLVSDPYQLIFATLIFTFIPSAFDWLIMGGGLTRSVGFFFFLLSLTFIHRMYTRQRWQDVLWTALFSSLTVLSHPEAALYAAAGALVFFLFFGKNRQGIVRSLAVAGLVLQFSAPWWLSVVRQYGVAPFFAAGGTGLGHYAEYAFGLFQFYLTHEYGLPIISALVVIGLFFSLARRDYFLLIWFVVFFLVQPRSAPRFLSIPMALAASGMILRLLGWLDQQKQGAAAKTQSTPLTSRASRWFFLFLFGQWIYSAFATGLLVVLMAFSPADQIAFAWIRANTPPASRFLVLTGESPLTDPVAEWFPALTDQVSITTVQGYEWEQGAAFDDMVDQAEEAQLCAAQNYPCLEAWSEQSGNHFDYIYLHLPGESTEEPAFGELARLQGLIEPIYQADGVFVYRVR